MGSECRPANVKGGLEDPEVRVCDQARVTPFSSLSFLLVNRQVGLGQWFQLFNRNNP